MTHEVAQVHLRAHPLSDGRGGALCHHWSWRRTWAHLSSRIGRISKVGSTSTCRGSYQRTWGRLSTSSRHPTRRKAGTLTPSSCCAMLGSLALIKRLHRPWGTRAPSFGARRVDCARPSASVPGRSHYMSRNPWCVIAPPVGTFGNQLSMADSSADSPCRLTRYHHLAPSATRRRSMSRSLVSVTISRHLARWLLLALVGGPDDSASKEVRSERSPSGPSTRAFASQANTTSPSHHGPSAAPANPQRSSAAPRTNGSKTTQLSSHP